MIKAVGQFHINISHCLGKGQSSQVYLATNAISERFAAKVISLQRLKGTRKQLVNNQISILTKLKHPNILSFYQTVSTDSNLYIITQLCDHDLRRLIPIDASHENYIWQLLQGLSFLQKNFIVHRDIKPANILVRKQKCFYGDFGHAVSKSYNPNYLVGTVVYAAPQCLSKCEYSHKSDVWSLGVVIYEMLTGVNPFIQGSIERVKQRINGFELKKSEIGSRWKLLLECMLKKQPQLRKTASQILQSRIQNVNFSSEMAIEIVQQFIWAIQMMDHWPSLKKFAIKKLNLLIEGGPSIFQYFFGSEIQPENFAKIKRIVRKSLTQERIEFQDQLQNQNLVRSEQWKEFSGDHPVLSKLIANPISWSNQSN